MSLGRIIALAVVALLHRMALADAGQFPGEPWRPAAAERPVAQICHMIQHSAEGNGLPPEFFARLIWKESRFDARAVSPKGARGIAQFMPGTAKLRGLEDPFDPAQAIPASAAYLAELKAQFGNLGLAAAAYNAGEERVADWLADRRGLPGETLDYVHSITFRPAAWFREPGREIEPKPLSESLAFAPACRQLPVMQTRAALYAGAEWQPWGAQVAGNRSQARALSQYARVERRFGGILGEAEPMLIAKRIGLGRGRVWTVQIGADSRGEASRLCSRLRSAGGACIVQRN